MDDNDTYGRHAEKHDRPAGVDGELFGRQVRFPWTFIVDPTLPEGRHRTGHYTPAGVYLEREGLIYHTGHLDGYLSVRGCLRWGEKPVPQPRSLKELTSQN
jgi:hypothetical protein